jgi:hypothetical protein
MADARFQSSFRTYGILMHVRRAQVSGDDLAPERPC